MHQKSEKRHIYIDNVGSDNLGAWLMLGSIGESLFNQYSYNRLGVVNSRAFRYPSDVFGKILPGRNHNIQFLREQSLFIGKNPITILAKYLLNKPITPDKNQIPFISLRDCSTLLDAGGFWLGHPWNNNIHFLNSKIDIYSKIRENGGKVIFLPQAFGQLDPHKYKPFFENVDLAYARDRISLKNLQEVFLKNHIKDL